MSKKKIVLSIIAMVLVIAIGLTAYVLTNPRAKDYVLSLFSETPEAPVESASGESTETTAGGISYTVTVTHADGSTKEFSYTTTEKYVGTLLQQEGLIEGPIEAYGIYIQVVDGERAVYEENGAYWAFYENGEYALAGIDQTVATEGAHYELVYTIG